MLIEITEEDRNIITEFLNRTNLKGAEVMAFSTVLNKIHKDVSNKYEKIKKEEINNI